MRCFGLAEIVESKTPEFKRGDNVACRNTWLSTPARNTIFIKFRRFPSSRTGVFLGNLGFTGMADYFGMMEIAKPEKGETLVVSAAAGGTSSIAGHGKIHSCRVVGMLFTGGKIGKTIVKV
jgi:NADPH-dependent curcumin reductase CurA